jgi:hypothetical protein
MKNTTFRQECALVILGQFANKVFDKQIQREAVDAGLEVDDLVVAHILNLTDAMCAAFDT